MIAALLAVAAAAAPSTAVGVGLSEFNVAAYRTRIPAGTVRFNASNLGEDIHDLAVSTARGRVVARLAPLKAGERATLKVRLRTPGRYRLVCTIADHEARGMRATVRVVKRR